MVVLDCLAVLEVVVEAVLEAAVGVLVAAVQPGRAMTAVQDTEMDTILMLSEVVEEAQENVLIQAVIFWVMAVFFNGAERLMVMR